MGTEPPKTMNATNCDGTPARGEEGTVPRLDDPVLPTRDFCLALVSGAGASVVCEIPSAAPHRFTVGKSPVCDLTLPDPAVSRRHIALEPRGGVLHLEDLGSTNGTFVNGVRVVEALLQGGETIRLGSTALRVEVGGKASAGPMSAALGFRRVIGASPQMRQLYPFCDKLARSSIPVIIEGETGTGKELLAESLHDHGPRAKGPFVVFDCTAVAPTLMESVLFGHERGAFTGADVARPGVFERAHGGTLFIDEIGDLEYSLQARLLRAVERGEVRRVGATDYVKVDVRVICATRRDLEAAIQEHRFRDDLYHRLAVARIELPPLRNRTGDIELLADYFWGELGGGSMPPGFRERLRAHRWPGNVRELRNVVARTIALGDEEPMGEGAPENNDLPSLIAELTSRDVPFTKARDKIVDAFLREFVTQALARHGGNVTRASAAVGVSRRYFDRIRERTRKAT
jgi:two-component system response regulator HydG